MLNDNDLAYGQRNGRGVVASEIRPSGGLSRNLLCGNVN